jgi:hypothetical protein
MNIEWWLYLLLISPFLSFLVYGRLRGWNNGESHGGIIWLSLLWPVGLFCGVITLGEGRFFQIRSNEALNRKVALRKYKRSLKSKEPIETYNFETQTPEMYSWQQ